MDYQINYSFLQAWLDANPQYTKKDILNALDSTDYVTLNRWINGDRPMQPDAMCRFCNHFGVPLSCFFKDGDAIADVTPGKPSQNDQLEPNSGYPSGNKTRGQGGVNPTTDEHEASVLPRQYAPQQTQFTFVEPQPAVKTEPTDIIVMQHKMEIERLRMEHEREMNALKLEHMKEITAIHKEYNGMTLDERKYYIDMIAEISRKNTRNTGRQSISMVAEEISER